MNQICKNCMYYKTNIGCSECTYSDEDSRYRECMDCHNFVDKGDCFYYPKIKKYVDRRDKHHIFFTSRVRANNFCYYWKQRTEDYEDRVFCIECKFFVWNADNEEYSCCYYPPTPTNGIPYFKLIDPFVTEYTYCGLGVRKNEETDQEIKSSKHQD